LGFEAGFGIAEVGFVDFDSKTVATAVSGGQKSGAGAHKRVEDGVARERKHSDKAVGQFSGKRGRMLSSRFAGQGPDLLEPIVMLFLGKS